MRAIHEKQKEEMALLQSENEQLHQSHLDLISEKTSLCSTLTDAKNEALFHQSFAEKHHVKRKEVHLTTHQDRRTLSLGL
jgi:hypothetical protein